MMWLHLIDRLGFHPGTGCDAHSFACRGKTRTTLDNRWEHRQVTQRTRTELTVNGHPLRWSSRHSRDWLCPALSVALLVHAEVVPVWHATNQASPLLRSHRANGRSMLPTGINKLFRCRSKLVKIASLRGLGRRALLARKHSLGPWSLSSAIAASFPGITSASSCDKVDHSVPQPVEPRSQHTGTISVLNCELEIIRGPPMAKDSASVTPWNRAVASGVDLLRNPRYNKGLAFDDEERNYYFLQGLLPPAVIPQDLQVMRIMENLQTIENPLHKYVAMMDLLERNEKLFYRVLIQFVEELLPIVYTPTVGEACQKYGVIFRRPHGLYISFKERCKVLDVIRNWPEDRVEVIVVTDGERILGLGDLGCQGMGIPCGKLNLYTALGGVHPTKCLPVTLDVGTNNRELLDDPYYIGLKQPRVAGEEYDGLVDEFMTAVKQAYGEKVLVQFEDFANHNAFRLLEKYAKTHLVFNDDIQGTAAVTLAGLVAALKGSGGSLADHRIMMLGAGEAGTGIAEMIAKEISRQGNIPLEEARKKIYLLDSKGLIVASRLDSLPQPYKRNYAHDNEFCPDLITAVKSLKPSILIGTSGQRAAFTREVLEAMASINKRPIILALSNPTSKSECTAEEAYNATEGRALFASGSPFGPVEINGKKILSAQANNAYIFPGLGLGCNISGAVRVHDEYFLEAAVALASEVTEEHINQGLLYPPFKGIRRISARIATAVARKAYDLGLATHLPEPENLLEYIENSMYAPDYDKYR